MKITIPGDPIPKARARVTRKGFAYDPQHSLKKKTIKFLQQSVRDFYEKAENRQEGYRLSIGEAFNVDWHFYMPIPKSFNQSKKNASNWGMHDHMSKPDLSNMVKFYEDCANGILWKDDSQIVHCYLSKKYSHNPRTEIVMTPIPKPKEDLKNIISLFSPNEISEIVDEARHLVIDETTLPYVASFLSKLADQHGKKLAKISKNYPGYWKKIG